MLDLLVNVAEADARLTGDFIRYRAPERRGSRLNRRVWKDDVAEAGIVSGNPRVRSAVRGSRENLQVDAFFRLLPFRMPAIIDDAQRRRVFVAADKRLQPVYEEFLGVDCGNLELLGVIVEFLFEHLLQLIDLPFTVSDVDQRRNFGVAKNEIPQSPCSSNRRPST